MLGTADTHTGVEWEVTGAEHATVVWVVDTRVAMVVTGTDVLPHVGVVELVESGGLPAAMDRVPTYRRRRRLLQPPMPKARDGPKPWLMVCGECDGHLKRRCERLGLQCSPWPSEVRAGEMGTQPWGMDGVRRGVRRRRDVRCGEFDRMWGGSLQLLSLTR